MKIKNLVTILVCGIMFLFAEGCGILKKDCKQINLSNAKSFCVDASGINDAIQLAIASLHNQVGSKNFHQISSENYIVTSAEQFIVQGQYIWRITFKPQNLLPEDPSKGLIGKGGEVFVNVDLKTKTTKILYGE